MEQSVNMKENRHDTEGIESLLHTLTEDLEGRFALPDFDVRQFSPLTLAYIGDAVYELLIRTILVRSVQMPVNRLHRRASQLVNAETQARMAEVLQEVFTEEEEAVFHRGRNAKANTRAKNASIVAYRKATGLEAVCGYLYLKGDMERLMSLLGKGLQDASEHEIK